MLRDFLMLLRRYTASSVLNIVGMALAFASAYLILVQVNFDMSYNRKIPNAENIYRMDKPSLIKEGMWSTLNNRYDPSEVCEHVPGIIGVTSMGLYRADIAFRFVINRPNGSNTLKAKMALIERSGLDVVQLYCCRRFIRSVYRPLDCRRLSLLCQTPWTHGWGCSAF